MTEDVANQIYDVLADVCGANPWERDSFIRAFLKTDQRIHRMTEYRFCGKLDFGGKFWRNNNRFYVSCYPENMNDERRAIIDRANVQLAAIRATVEGNW